MPGMFDSIEIKGMAIANRFVRSATWEGLAEDSGAVTDRLVELTAGLAQGGVGLIIPGFAYVSASGQPVKWQTGVYSDDQISGLARMADAVHQAGGKVCLQIVHGGIRTSPDLAGIDRPAGPSEMKVPDSDLTSRELSLAEIAGIVEDFGRAAGRTKEAGFDAVQLHCAHAYLLHQFLSPYFNRRGDRYGGNAHNRARIMYEAYEAVRGAVGDDFPVLIKINSTDFINGGLELEESVKAATELAAMGLDGVEVSGGLNTEKLAPSRLKIDSPDKEAYHRLEARAFKSRLRIPVIVVGGIRSIGIISDILENGEADMVSLCRPFIREPELVNRWQSGDRAPAECISCNGCFKPARAGEGIRCIVKEKGEDQQD